jgi:hypothetical protein
MHHRLTAAARFFFMVVASIRTPDGFDYCCLAANLQSSVFWKP